MDNLTINKLTELILALAKEKGWGTKPKDINVGEKMALIHSEISEAFEAYRQGNMDERHGFKEELADALMRILHLAGIFGIDLETETLKKLEIDKGRTWNWNKLNEKHS